MPKNFGGSPVPVSEIIKAAEEEYRRRENLNKQRMLKEAMGKLLEAYETSHAVTGNPLFVWAAWKGSRGASLPAPEWVSKALDGYASSLVQMVNEPPKQRVPAAVGNAIGFGAGRNGNNPFSMMKKLANSEKYMALFFALRMEGLDETPAIEQVAFRLGSFSSTVRRRLMGRCKIFNVSLQDLTHRLLDPEWGARLALIGQGVAAMFAHQQGFQNPDEL